MVQATHRIFCITIMIYLVVQCLLVSSAPSNGKDSPKGKDSSPEEQDSCSVRALNSNQETFVRLLAEVENVNTYTENLKGGQLTPTDVKNVAKKAICSEKIQSADRAYLADHPDLETLRKVSATTLKTINKYIIEITKEFNELVYVDHTTAEVEAIGRKIEGIRTQAKPLNLKLMVNAGYVAPK
ncbi:hypothetical protein CROQUDRAFT_717143 [Cronartium quercuum f. sp. fusiforme G11]|uniref:Uncharacterized protein n=1 Tax=Cronartium quercuum f. sp. fusiforme G11 TaxID=708437 RepID=A0A9P6T9E5_9BASI|nr:hypothetical protein CROQUDRAFT_717143 [Cronartium quercuum f. sp. fusiforme G11]